MHLRKLRDLGEFLVKEGLAKKSQKSRLWYRVAPKTANEFMAYLASVLGNAQNEKFFPVTHGPSQIESVFNSSLTRAQSKLRPIRTQVIDRLFPTPAGILSVGDIASFKSQHEEHRKQFRRHIEKKIMAIAAIADVDLRKLAISNLHDEIKDDLSIIERRIQSKFGKGSATFVKMGFEVAAKLSKPVGIMKAILDATKTSNKRSDSPILYAAYARRKLKLIEDDDQAASA